MKHYSQRDVEELNEHYFAHLAAMTSEGLHSKSAIAAELAYRDKAIEFLKKGESSINMVIKQYVTGFMFSPDLKNVALIHKNRPEWQAGRINGIGGKVEVGEWPIDAMTREFLEEAGVMTYDSDWKQRIVMRRESGPNAFTLNVFAAVSDKLWDVRSITDERVEIVPVADVLKMPYVPNMVWMLPLVMDKAVEIVRIDYSL